MRILWFTNTPSCYSSSKQGYNGGGWISSLEQEIRKQTDIKLGICFHMNKEPTKLQIDEVTYYPVATSRNNIFSKVKNQVCECSTILSKRIEKKYLTHYLSVIKDFEPDIIHIFGSEKYYGLISLYETKIPIVLHIQGILNPCYNALFPPNYSIIDFIFSDINPFNIFRRWLELKLWNVRIERERRILPKIPYFLGRTEWDKRLVSLMAPQATYFYCSEILRSIFYEKHKRGTQSTQAVIVSTISPPLYKGIDVILKTAYLLSSQIGLDFEWRVFGIAKIKLAERKTGINHKDVKIKLMGITSAEKLCEQLLNSALYIHPSYIDNSPNSICEAQILGCPVIAANVGGISSLINDGVDGYLVPANDPYQIAYLIKYIVDNPHIANYLGENARKTAMERHNKTVIIDTLLNVYGKILL